MGSELVTITPKPGSRKFRVHGTGMTQFNTVQGSSDPRDVTATGTYKGQRFPNSRQVFKPRWSFTKGRWLLDGVSGSVKSLEKLSSIASACKLKYEKNDPRYPGYIKEVDIYDFDDAFMNHSKLKMIAREGEFVLDKSKPKDQILIMAVQASKQFAMKGERPGPLSQRVKYLITDKNIDAAAKRASRDLEMKASKLFAQLSSDQKMKIAMGMGLIMRETDKLDVVDDLLWAASKDSKSRAANGLTTQEYFIAMCETSPNELNVRFLIQKARGEGHLKRTDEGWFLFGRSVGRSDLQVYEYFKNPEHSQIIQRLNDAMTVDPVPVPQKASKEALIDLDKEPQAPEPPKGQVIEEDLKDDTPGDNIPNMDEIVGGNEDNEE